MIPKVRDISYKICVRECGLTPQETTILTGNRIEIFKISPKRTIKGLDDMKLYYLRSSV